MGLIIHVYRSADGMDCTLDGLSSRYAMLCLVNAEGPFEPNADRPAVLLQNHTPGCLRIVPAQRDGDRWAKVPYQHSMGGNFANTSDSRFGEACQRLLGHRFYGAVAIHDRVE